MATRSATVLVVDDEPHVLELIRITLEADRVRVVAAPDGETALDLAHALGPGVIFLDVHLPGVDGLEVCRRLRGDPACRRATIVMLTAAAQKDDIALGYAAGADHYLTKPFSPVALLTLLERACPQTVQWIPG